MSEFLRDMSQGLQSEEEMKFANLGRSTKHVHFYVISPSTDCRQAWFTARPNV
jgi:hypothetical protein